MSVIRDLEGGGQAFFCPGCESVHAVNIRGPKWSFNNDKVRPTFRPSILVTYRHLGEPGEGQDERCHSFVTDGQIQFLLDCTHNLKGQTVALPEWPHAKGAYGGIIDEV